VIPLAGREATLERAGAALLLAAAVVVPIRVFLNEVAGRDLHLTAILIAGAAALAGLRVLAAGPRPVHALDAWMIAFLLWCAAHLLWIGEPHPRALKGFLIETRFAWIYLVARALGVGRAYGSRLLTLYLGLGVTIGLYGLVEYFFWWGSLPRSLEIVGDPRYTKMRIPRLYSLVITPAGVAYFLYGALCAAGARWTGEPRGRGLALAATAVSWIAIPLTLTRSAFAWAIAIVVALAVTRRELRSFLAVSVLCGALSIFLFWSTGVATGLATYARGATSDRSAEIHREALEDGSATLADRPLGFGFGHAGALAFGERGLTRIGETYYLILGGQAGVPAMALLAVVLGLVAWIGVGAFRDPSEERRSLGVFLLTFLFGVVMGSFFLPIGSTAWIQLYLFTIAAALVNDREAELRSAASGSGR
jgi:hypothetical protein